MPQLSVENSNLESDIITNDGISSAIRGPRIEHFTHQTFTRLLESQVAQTPNNIAVAFEGETLTYTELNGRASQLAHHLRSLGVGRESLVAICIDRSLEMAIGIVGILKSGAAYLPLDPDYPRERLAFMLNDAQPAVIVTTSELVSLLPANDAHIVLLDNDAAAIQSNPHADPAEAPRPNDLAYVIYTSGSTGTPKGAMIEHGSL